MMQHNWIEVFEIGDRLQAEVAAGHNSMLVVGSEIEDMPQSDLVEWHTRRIVGHIPLLLAENTSAISAMAVMFQWIADKVSLHWPAGNSRAAAAYVVVVLDNQWNPRSGLKLWPHTEAADSCMAAVQMMQSLQSDKSRDNCSHSPTVTADHIQLAFLAGIAVAAAFAAY